MAARGNVQAQVEVEMDVFLFSFHVISTVPSPHLSQYKILFTPDIVVQWANDLWAQGLLNKKMLLR